MNYNPMDAIVEFQGRRGVVIAFNDHYALIKWYDEEKIELFMRPGLH